MDIKYMDTLEDFFETLDSSLSLLSSGVIANPLDDLYDKTDAATIQQLTDDMHALDALILHFGEPDTPLAPNDMYIKMFERFYKRAQLNYTKRLLAKEPLTRAENEIEASRYFIEIFEKKEQYLNTLNHCKLSPNQLFALNRGDSIYAFGVKFEQTHDELIEIQVVNVDSTGQTIELKAVESNEPRTFSAKNITHRSKAKTPTVHFYKSVEDGERALREFNKARQEAYVDEFKNNPELFFTTMVGNAIRFEQMSDSGDEENAQAIIRLAKMHLSKNQYEDLKNMFFI